MRKKSNFAISNKPTLRIFSSFLRFLSFKGPSGAVILVSCVSALSVGSARGREVESKFCDGQ